MLTNSIAVNHLKNYGTLIKPRITLLVLVTTYVGVHIAADRSLSITFLFFTLLATALGSSAASTLNNYVDRELDQKMSRTKERCLPVGRIAPVNALILGIFLMLAGIGIMAFYVNLLSAGLLLFTILFYVFVYTLYLKRQSPYSTEVGSISGAMPPVIGWTAATNSLGIEALALFLIMFTWQPPHFWALGIYYRDDYEQANIPRFPVVKGVEATKWRSLFYNFLLIPASASLYWIGMADMFYLVASSILSVVYFLITLRFAMRSSGKSSAIKIFSFSNLYLLMLFVLIFLSSPPGT